jgi:hypothetical protein
MNIQLNGKKQEDKVRGRSADREKTATCRSSSHFLSAYSSLTVVLSAQAARPAPGRYPSLLTSI